MKRSSLRLSYNSTMESTNGKTQQTYHGEYGDEIVKTGNNVLRLIGQEITLLMNQREEIKQKIENRKLELLGTKQDRIILANGEVCLLSPEDYAEISQYKWHMGARYQVVRNDGKGSLVTLSRELLKPEQRLFVDHVNGDKLDNRRENLRLATRGQNQTNRITRNVRPYGKKWQLRFTDKKGIKHSYIYNTEEEAMTNRDILMPKHQGEFAWQTSR